MKCPNCQIQFSDPGSRHACVDGVEVLMVICPECETVLGVVNHSHSGYFSRTETKRTQIREKTSSLTARLQTTY